MMKALKDLTKDELISFVANYDQGKIDIFAELAGCASCEGTPDTIYYYICEECNQLAVGVK